MKNISVEYDINGRTFNYNGVYISLNDNFLVMDDKVEGIISLNVKNIIKIREVKK